MATGSYLLILHIHANAFNLGGTLIRKNMVFCNDIKTGVFLPTYTACIVITYTVYSNYIYCV